MLVDLSHSLEPGMPSYPGLPEPKFHVFLAHSDSPGQQKYVPGTTFQIARYELGGNTGTYLDAPFHRHSDGLDLRELPLERMVHLRGAVVHASSASAIGPQVFANLHSTVRLCCFIPVGASDGRTRLTTFVQGHF